MSIFGALGVGGTVAKGTESAQKTGGSMSIPIPSLSATGGAAGPSNAISGLGNVKFGNIYKGFGIFGLGFLIVGGLIVWKISK